MVESTVHTLGAVFAIVTGTGAGLLALLFWRVLRASPFGTTIALLSVTMSATTVYHVVLLVASPETLLLEALRSALYTLVAGFLWLVVASHHRIERSAAGR